MAFWSGNGGGVTCDSGTELNVGTWSINHRARLAETRRGWRKGCHHWPNCQKRGLTMAGSVLSELYVDVIARGLQGAMGGISDLQKRIAEAADAGTVLRTGLDTTGLSMKQLGKMAQDFSGGMVKGAGAIAAPLTAATATITGFAQAGLQGTVQAERLSQAYTEFTRLIAGALLPVIDAISSGLETVNRWLRQAGVTGQQVFLIIAVGIVAATVAATVFLAVVSAIAVAVSVATGGLNVLIGALIGLQMAIAAALVVGAAGAAAGLMSMFEDSRAAVGALVIALGQLWEASQPLLQAGLQLAAGLAKFLIVDRLVMVINVLTAAALVAEKLLKVFLKIKEVVMGLAAIRAIAPGIGQGKMKEVTLNQTGTENAQGTFARIQEAVFKAARDNEEESKDAALERLEAIKSATVATYNLLASWYNLVRGPLLPAAPRIEEQAQGGAGERGARAVWERR